MKNKTILMLGACIALIATVYAAKINTITGQGEGMDWARFSDVLQKNSTARNAFVTALGGTQSLSGAGAVDVVNRVTKLTTTGAAQALTLANGVDGQMKIIVHDVDGGSAVLTPTTKTGFTTITFTNVGESATLVYVTTRGWIVVALNGAVAA